jgi:SprB repeat
LLGILSIGPKTPADPLFGQGNPNVFYIDGGEAKELYLTRGITYSFNVLTPAHPFQISTDLTGGNANFLVSNGQTGAPSQNGVVTFTPNSGHPALLYYPCQFHPFMGYKVNIINGQQSEDLSNLNPGIYNVLVTDANGCTAISQYQVNELPSPVTVSGSITNSICGTYTGSVELSISGGIPPYTTIWDTLNTTVGPNFSVIVGPKTTNNPYYAMGNPDCFYIDAVEAPAQNLVRGMTYTYNVFNPGHPFHFTTDSVGASTAGFVSLGQANAPNDNGLISYTPALTSPSNLYYACANHALMGGKTNLQSGYATTDLNNVKPGIYTVLVIDSLGCVAQASFTVAEISSTIAINATTVVPTSCVEAADGSIDVSITGGTPPYSITWDTVNINNAGVFSVMVGMKSGTNPLYGVGSPECFYIDGDEQKAITLTRGVGYLFNVLALGHSWHISSDEAGGNLLKIVTIGQSGAPIDDGAVTFNPNSKHNNQLYYQCGVHTYMGAPVNIIDGPSSTFLENLPAGQYTAVVTDAVGCSSVAVITVPSGTASCSLVLNLKVLLQGMYSGGSTMSPRLFNTGMSSDPTAVDNITVDLRDPNDFSVVATVTDVLHTDGMMNISLPASVLGNSYYIVVHHENSIETWSKDPVPFLVSPVSFDFSQN